MKMYKWLCCIHVNNSVVIKIVNSIELAANIQDHSMRYSEADLLSQNEKCTHIG